jgi:hypothetical protein
MSTKGVYLTKDRHVGLEVANDADTNTGASGMSIFMTKPTDDQSTCFQFVLKADDGTSNVIASLAKEYALMAAIFVSRGWVIHYVDEQRRRRGMSRLFHFNWFGCRNGFSASAGDHNFGDYNDSLGIDRRARVEVYVR